MSRLDEFSQDGQIKLITYHYLQAEPSKSIPILIGFINEIEKEFFELFITVSGIGPRAALKALNKPISLIAKAINDADSALLCSLPGIGRQRAKEIIAKLQGKMGKFGLIQDERKEKRTGLSEDIKKEALEVLSQLQYKKQEAKEMIEKALERCPGINSTEGLLNEVYRQKVR
jgi:Holliday junction DNA helicase RuvA